MKKRFHLNTSLRSCAFHLAVVGVGMVVSLETVAAPVLTYQTSFLGSNHWRYTYLLQGDSPVGGFDGVTIYFSSVNYALLSNGVAPLNWDPLIVQPDTSLNADGFFDLLYSSGPLTGVLSPINFSIDFNYTGTGTPSTQRYELYTASPFAVTFSGMTQASGIPEPSSFVLVALALACASCIPKARSRRSRPSS